MTDRIPAETFSVASFIQDELEARSWTVRDLAIAMHRPEHRVAEIVDGKERITRATAQWLAAAFTTSAELWLNLDAAAVAGGEPPVSETSISETRPDQAQSARPRS